MSLRCDAMSWILVAEARGAGAADDDGDLELLHGEGYPVSI
jgi:hypothetical protein